MGGPSNVASCGLIFNSTGSSDQTPQRSQLNPTDSHQADGPSVNAPFRFLAAFGFAVVD